LTILCTSFKNSSQVTPITGDELIKIGVPLYRENGDLSISQSAHHWQLLKGVVNSTIPLKGLIYWFSAIKKAALSDCLF